MANAQQNAISLLALGDSYTIGESVPVDQSWPMQLTKWLRDQEVVLEEPVVIAKTGWTTTELLTELNDFRTDKGFDFVTLLIGVNNQYRGFDFSVYKKEWQELLYKALDYANGRRDRVLVISIPDYGVTPFAANSNPSRIGKEIDAYNSYVKSQCELLKLQFIDITPESRLASEAPDLIASDGLHPSALMYSQWVAHIKPWIMERLDKIKR